MKLNYFIFIGILLYSFSGFAKDDWGQNGHRAIAEIAFAYLNDNVKNEITNLLDGESLALASTFADEIKSDKQYDAYKVWHYVNMPLDSDYQNTEKNEAGDIVVGIEKCIQVLKDETSANV